MACYNRLPSGRYWIEVTNEGTGGLGCLGAAGLVETGVGQITCDSFAITFGDISLTTIELSDPVATYAFSGITGDCNRVFTFVGGDNSAADELTMYGWCYPEYVHLATDANFTFAPSIQADLIQEPFAYPPVWTRHSVDNPGNLVQNPLTTVSYYYDSHIYLLGTEGASDSLNIPDPGNLCGGTQIYSNGIGIGVITPISNSTFATIAFGPLFAMPGHVITIYGSGFTGTTSVSFNGTPAGTFTVRSDGVITAVVPPAVTPGPITVDTPTGPITTEQNLFTTTVIPGPAVFHYSNG